MQFKTRPFCFKMFKKEIIRGLRLYCNRKRGINKRDFYDHFSTVILCLEKLNFGAETYT